MGSGCAGQQDFRVAFCVAHTAAAALWDIFSFAGALGRASRLPK